MSHEKKYYLHKSSYVDDNVTIGDSTKIWHFCHIQSGAKIGGNTTIGQNVNIANNVIIGNNVKIQNNVSVYDGVTIEDDVFCGPSCVFTNVINPRSSVSRKEEFRKSNIGKGASIGANATIICGNDLGAYCFIAAGATVTKTVPNFAIMAGTPARRIGWMSKAGSRLESDLVCPIDKSKYFLESENKLVEIDNE